MDQGSLFSLRAEYELDLHEQERCASEFTKRAMPESELQFLARRAMDESRLAKEALNPAAAAAHSYLAAAYSAQIVSEMTRQREFEELVLSIA